MRTSQWFIIGFLFIVMGSWFVFLDNTWRGSCDFSDTSPVTQADIYACVNGEILDPFISLLYPLGMVFLFCGIIESVAKQGKKE